MLCKLTWLKSPGTLCSKCTFNRVHAFSPYLTSTPLQTLHPLCKARVGLPTWYIIVISENNLSCKTNSHWALFVKEFLQETTIGIHIHLSFLHISLSRGFCAHTCKLQYKITISTEGDMCLTVRPYGSGLRFRRNSLSFLNTAVSPA